MSTIYNDINIYFDKVTEYSNQEIYQKYLSKWEELAIPVGLGIAVDRIRKNGDTARKYGDLLTEQTQNVLISNCMPILVGMQDAVVLTGNQGYTKLIESLSHPDEDIGAFAALELASKELGKLSSIEILEKTYKSAKRTGFHVAIAIALGRQRKYIYFAQLAKKYVIRDENAYSNLVESAALAHKELQDTGAYDRLKSAGEQVYSNRDDAIQGSIFALTYQTAMSLVVLNIASRGDIPKIFFSDWVY